MTDLSKRPIFALFFRAKFPKKRCKKSPMTNGSTTCKSSFCTTVPNSKLFELVIKIPIQSGVTTIPKSPERLALKIAVGIFPLARETITTEELTVEGRAPRKNSASHKFDAVPVSKKGTNERTRRGKRTKVVSWTRMCTL